MTKRYRIAIIILIGLIVVLKALCTYYSFEGEQILCYIFSALCYLFSVSLLFISGTFKKSTKLFAVLFSAEVLFIILGIVLPNIPVKFIFFLLDVYLLASHYVWFPIVEMFPKPLSSYMAVLLLFIIFSLFLLINIWGRKVLRGKIQK